MTTRNILGGSKRTLILGHVAAGGTLQTSSIIDMQGFDSVTFDAIIGSITTGQTKGTVKVQGGNVANGSDMADLVGTTLTIPDSAQAAFGHTIEVVRPSYRYLQVLVTRTGQQPEVLAVVATQHHEDKSFLDNDTTTWPVAVCAISPQYSQTYYSTQSTTPVNAANTTVVSTYRNAS